MTELEKRPYILGRAPYNFRSCIFLWKKEGDRLIKIATFSSLAAARIFVLDTGFELSDSLKKKLAPLEKFKEEK